MTGIWGASARLRAAPDARVLRTVVLAVAAVQALVLGLLARRGSWLSDDLDFLVQGDRGFAPDELLTPLNDHIAPGLRFVYAAFAQLAPLNYDFTVGWRVAMQALAVALMGLLLLRILGDNRWVIVGTVLYALTPLSMPSFMSLSSGVNNLAGSRLRPVAAARDPRLVLRPPWPSSCLRPPFAADLVGLLGEVRAHPAHRPRARPLSADGSAA